MSLLSGLYKGKESSLQAQEDKNDPESEHKILQEKMRTFQVMQEQQP